MLHSSSSQVLSYLLLFFFLKYVRVTPEGTGRFWKENLDFFLMQVYDSDKPKSHVRIFSL